MTAEEKLEVAVECLKSIAEHKTESEHDDEGSVLENDIAVSDYNLMVWGARAALEEIGVKLDQSRDS